MLKSMEIRQEIDELTAQIQDKINKKLTVPEDVQSTLEAKIREYKTQKAAEDAAKNENKGEEKMVKKGFG